MRKIETALALAGLACALAMPNAAMGAEAAAPAAAEEVKVKINFPGGRIAFSSDGNIHDPDDIGATPFSMALINAAGLNKQFVHYDHSDHLGKTNDEMEPKMVESAIGGAKRFNLDVKRIFNDQTELEAAIENFRIEGNKSSASDPLWYICAGPMEAPWRCISAVDPEKRQFIHVISHSGWNDKHGDTPEMTHKWTDLAPLGVTVHHIRDQNGSNGDRDFNTPREHWNWLRDSADENLRWLHSRDQFDDKYDVSDAGMVFWLITGGPNGGNEKGGWPEAKSLFENPVK
jgi:hypothetical protein